MVQQTQQDSSKADSAGLRYTTPAAFRMPVTIRVGGATATGDVVARAELSRRQDTIVVRDVKRAATMVIFDDGSAILKRLTFDQPTAWLAVQLDRDSDLWNRHWVIAQLGQRPNDPLAAGALAKAATSSDYFLTRAAAVQALAGFPAVAALPPLQAALKHTSAQVRAAAVEALGTVEGGGPQAATLARQVWTSDSSSAVRAAAVVAIAQTDSAGRRPFLLQALLTPSYRDEIQNSAYRAIARSGDTTMVDSVNAHAGDHHFAPHVLAALASRGSTRALDLLAKLLNDDRTFVRRWALEAFQFTLRRELAQPALQVARAGLKFADTQKAVDELMQEWSKAGGKELLRWCLHAVRSRRCQCGAECGERGLVGAHPVQEIGGDRRGLSPRGRRAGGQELDDRIDPDHELPRDDAHRIRVGGGQHAGPAARHEAARRGAQAAESTTSLFLAHGVTCLLGAGDAIDAVAELRDAAGHRPQPLEVASLFRGGWERRRVPRRDDGVLEWRGGSGQHDDQGSEHPNSSNSVLRPGVIITPWRFPQPRASCGPLRTAPMLCPISSNGPGRRRVSSPTTTVSAAPSTRPWPPSSGPPRSVSSFPTISSTRPVSVPIRRPP